MGNGSRYFNTMTGDHKNKTASLISKCRICGRALFADPLLIYENMPAIAQNLPNLESLDDDKGINLKICQCSGCGTVQLDNDPVSYYKEVIRASAFSEEMRDFRMKQFGDFAQKYALKGKKIIEIGCGRGEYLSIIQKCGMKAYGLEYSDSSVGYCAGSGLNVSKGFIEREDYNIGNYPFDAFCILSFLEHLPDPNTNLRGIYNNLNDGAVGVVEVPNFDMILKNNLFSEFARDHLFYFTKDTLSAVLRLNGFEIISCDEVWHNYIISAVVRKRKKTDLSSFLEYQAKIKKEINDYISRFHDVAIWGAGHQAFAIMSLCSLGGKVRYVVDSAPFKQGKYTPATHIPIVAPDKLSSDPVKAVIIVAGSYSNEVARTMRDKFDKNISIAVLKDSGPEEI